jgi:hypothetical protein
MRRSPAFADITHIAASRQPTNVLFIIAYSPCFKVPYLLLISIFIQFANSRL